MGAKVEITRTDHTGAELRALSAKCADGAQVRRMLALALVLDGRSRSEAAVLNGMDRQTLRDWVHRYNEAGIEGLKSRESPGREPYLTTPQMAELRELVIKGPDPATNKVVRWRCVDLQAEVARRWSVEVHESTIGKWLGELGLTRLQPRPVHPKKDAAAEATFKKLRQSGARRTHRHHGWRADRDLVPGRGQGRSEGRSLLYLGATWLTTADGTR